MDSEPIFLSPDFKLYFTFPFNLGFAIERSRSDNKLKLRKLLENLNNEFKSYSWKDETFSTSLPLSFQNKDWFIHGEPRDSTKAKFFIENGFKKFQSYFSFEKLEKESVSYFDHGVGSVNWLICGKLLKQEAIIRLQALVMTIINDIRLEKESLDLFYHWKPFRTAMLKSCEKVDLLNDMWGILERGDRLRNPTRIVGENIILKSKKGKNSIQFPRDQINKYFRRFTGTIPIDTDGFRSQIEGIEYLAEGWDGQIAVITDLKREQWLMNLWQFSTNYYTILRDLDNYLYDQTNYLWREIKSIDIFRARKEMKAIQKIELAIDLITHEALPYNFGNIKEQITV